MIGQQDLQANIRHLEMRIDQALAKSGVTRDQLTLVAVTKQHPIELLHLAVESGLKVLGESRVQEALQKQNAIHEDIRWHLIGHLQTNKVKQVVGRFELIHSVDSVKLAREIQKQCEKHQCTQDILIQVNTSGEDSKFGNKPDETISLVQQISAFSRVHIKGLMTIGLFTDNETEIRNEFRILKSLFEQLKKMAVPNTEMAYLSMGMSNDFDIAIEEGSNMIRVGTALFGHRNY